MKVKVAAIVVIPLATIALLQTRPSAQDTAQPAKSVWDGVYTEEQAKRGSEVYGAACSSCHGPALDGGEMAPPLSGAGFSSNWDATSVGDLFERIRVTMPDGNPGSLTRQQYADVVTAILKTNGFPAGQTELPTQTEALKQIKIVATKPKG